MKKQICRAVAAAVLVTLPVVAGCVRRDETVKSSLVSSAVEKKTAQQTITGEVVGISHKAKALVLAVGEKDNVRSLTIKFDDATRGIDHVEKDHGAIVTYEMRGDEFWAVQVQPKIAALPEGAVEIKEPELKALMQGGTAFTLVDARPAKRYAQAHLKGALNLPVDEFAAGAGSVLPADKDALVVFYCGGPS